VITGGAGYVGHRLGCHIASQYPELGTVVLFDLRKPTGVLPKGVESVVGDLTNEADVLAAFRGATLVYHVASYGMSGYEAMQEDRIYKVNVQGTQNVIKACEVNGVSKLVYVSTYNTIFDGHHKIIGGTEESTTYVNSNTTSAAYSVTKAIAEQAVLKADGTIVSTANGVTRQLRTCALRPAGIWGPGEQRNIPRIVTTARSGLLQFTFGDRNSLVDWLHVDNLIQSLVLAAKALDRPDCPAGGKAYFVNDGEPANNFDFLMPIVQGLGYRWPRIHLPYRLVHFVALLMEIVCAIAMQAAGRIVWVPMLCRMEVEKCAITHYCKIDKARHDLGYNPVIYSKQEVVDWYKARGYGYQPVTPAAKAARAARILRVCVALVLMVVVLMSWRNTASGREPALAAKLAMQAVGFEGSAMIAAPPATEF